MKEKTGVYVRSVMRRHSELEVADVGSTGMETKDSRSSTNDRRPPPHHFSSVGPAR